MSPLLTVFASPSFLVPLTASGFSFGLSLVLSVTLLAAEEAVLADATLAWMRREGETERFEDTLARGAA